MTSCNQCHLPGHQVVCQHGAFLKSMKMLPHCCPTECRVCVCVCVCALYYLRGLKAFNVLAARATEGLGVSRLEPACGLPYPTCIIYEG